MYVDVCVSALGALRYKWKELETSGMRSIGTLLKISIRVFSVLLHTLERGFRWLPLMCTLIFRMFDVR